MIFIVEKLWYRRNPLRWILYPFSLLYRAIVICRRYYLEHFCQQQFPVPIIVVGNLTVGGVGKTPLVVSLARQLKSRGLQIGIVSRGYGARITNFPYEVKNDDDASQVGDEPLLLVKKTACPVVISPTRTQAVQYLLDNHQSQVIISDDGLQHYKMGRAIEIAVIDGVRGLGNGFCLPAGPLRESAKRLEQVDFIVVNGGVWPNAYRMDLIPGKITQIKTGKVIQPEQLTQSIAAVAAIGHPQRFFKTLTNLGILYNPYAFPDHHIFQPSDLKFKETMLVMTEKDAVKCLSFATDKMYFLPVEAQFDDDFWNVLWSHQQLRDVI